MQFGSGNNGQLTFLDIISLMSYDIGLQNLKLNVAQEDLDRQTQELDNRLHRVIDDIHMHLAEQDEKIDRLLAAVEEIKDGVHIQES